MVEMLRGGGRRDTPRLPQMGADWQAAGYSTRSMTRIRSRLESKRRRLLSGLTKTDRESDYRILHELEGSPCSGNPRAVGQSAPF